MKSLIGTVVRIEGNTPSAGMNGIIVAADEGLGFSVVREEDTEHFIYCSIGPLSPKWVNFEGDEVIEIWENSKEIIKEAAATGVLQMDKVGAGGQASSSSCPFS